MKTDLHFATPLLNAAGFLGFAPAGGESLRLGAFFTNPISLEPRSPAQGPRLLPFPGGFMLHTGYPNPGARAVRKHYSARWKRSARPIIAHLLARLPGEVKLLVQRLEENESLAAWEIGLPPEARPADLSELVAAAGPERPVILRLPLDRARELAAAARESGAAAVSLGAPRGLLPDSTGRLIQGRLYGPAVFPQALEATRLLAQAGLAVIGSGGVYEPWQARAMLAAGASAVQLDAVLWQGLSPEESWEAIAAVGRTAPPAPPGPAQSPPAG